MFFLHALFLFFLLGTPSSMAAVLPRSAGGYGNLRTRDVPSDPGYRPVGLDLHTRDLPAYKLLKGYWLLEVSYLCSSTLPCLTLYNEPRIIG